MVMDSVLQIASFVFLLGCILLITRLFSISGKSSRNVITSMSYYIEVSITIILLDV